MQLLYATMQLIAAHLQLIAAPTQYGGMRDDVVVVDEGGDDGEGKPSKPI